MRGFSWREELKQIFDSDFKLARTFIIVDYLLMLFCVLFFLIFINSDNSTLVFLFFFMISGGINYYSNRKLNLNKKLKGSLYEKKVQRPIIIYFAVLLTIMFLISIKTNRELKAQPIEKAINNFGYNVKAPSYIPFKPTRQYGWVDKKINQLEISYQKGNSIELDIYVTPKIPFDKRGEKVVLYGKNIGYFLKEDDETKLNWKRGGLYFSLIYGSQSTPTKKEILKIVNSMK